MDITYRASLTDLRFVLWVRQEVKIRMRVHVDKPWAEDVTIRIDTLGLESNEVRADLSDKAARDQYVRDEGRRMVLASDDGS